MATLRTLFVAAVLLSAGPARADPLARWQPHIAEASTRFGVPAEWIERVIRAESGGRTTSHGQPITSPAGAMGLMQLMPETWKSMRARLRLGSNPHDPRDNILAGTYYLRLMHDRFGYPGLFAAYNAGPGRYAAYLAGRARLPAETIGYLHTVTGTSNEAGMSAEPGTIFVKEVDGSTSVDTADPTDPHASIFFIHRPQR